MSTFQVSYNGTKIDTEPMQFNPRYQFDILLPNEDVNYTLVIFTLRVVVVSIPSRTPINEDLDTLPVYEITSPIFWYLYRKLYAVNEMATQRVPISVGSRE